MGAKQTKEEIAGDKLQKERDEAISRQRYYELYELRQDWEFVFGDEQPKQKKDVLQITDMTPRDVWMEDMYLFKQIVATQPDELFHPASEYALKWTPPGSSFKLLVPFDNPAMQESVIVQLSRYPMPVRKMVLFHFGPRDPNQTMFREAVHPASLVSYHHRNEVLKKLCDQFLENRMDIDEFKNTVGSNYDVWKRAMFNMLPEDEQVFHTYLTDLPEEENKPSQKVIDNEYMEGRISLQEYEDLKFPERKKRKDMEALVYPLKHHTGLCVICHDEETGCVQCNVCDNMLCISCLNAKFNGEDKEGSYLLVHRRFCLKLAALKPIRLAVNIPPAYLRELRMTGQGNALKLLLEETKAAVEEEDEDEEDEEDAEEKAYREEMERIKLEREYNSMMKENPPDLQKVIHIYNHKIEKKFKHIRKEALEQQVRIDEPGHSDFFVERLERLKQAEVDKLPALVINPATPLLAKAIALDLQESTTSKEFIDKLTLVINECNWLMEMTSEQHWDDLHNGVSVEEREAIVEEERRVRAVARAEDELHLAEEVAEKKRVEDEIKQQEKIDAAIARGEDPLSPPLESEESGSGTPNPEDLEAVAAQAVAEGKVSSSMLTDKDKKEEKKKKKKKKKEKEKENKDGSSDATGGDEKEHHHHHKHHSADADGKRGEDGKEAEEEHWVKPDKATRMLRKKSIHKHDGDAAILAAGAAGKAKAPHLEAATDVAEHSGEEESDEEKEN